MHQEERTINTKLYTRIHIYYIIYVTNVIDLNILILYIYTYLIQFHVPMLDILGVSGRCVRGRGFQSQSSATTFVARPNRCI